MLSPTLTASEPSLEGTRAVVEQARRSLGIPETPTVALDNVRPKEDGYKDDDNFPMHICSGTSTLACHGVFEGDGNEAFWSRYFLQQAQYGFCGGGQDAANRPRQVCYGDTLPRQCFFLCRCMFRRDLGSNNRLASNSHDLGEGPLTIVAVSKFTIAKILDTRSNSSGVEYKCELGPLRLPCALGGRDADGMVDTSMDTDSRSRAQKPLAASEEFYEELLFGAWRNTPELLARDSKTRLLQPRQKLKQET